MSFHGQCHCGAVQFDVDAPLPAEAVSCNCSHCRAKGFLLAFFPAAQVHLSQGEDVLRSYRFNTHKIEHRFCTVCGAQPFAQSLSPDGTPTVAVNLRCVPLADLDALKLSHYDGASS